MSRKKERPYGSSLKDKVDALFSGGQPLEAPRSIPLDEIALPEYQPRQYFDRKKLAELASTIAERGILSPLLVREIEGERFELIAGGRRYRAAQMAGLTSVPVVVLELTDGEALEVALLENIQREDLNPVEETEGILRLLETRLKSERSEVLSLLYRMRNEMAGLSRRNVSPKESTKVVEELFAPLGMTWKSFVETRLPLLKLPEELLEALHSGQIAYTKAKAIAKVKDSSQRKALLSSAISDHLSLAQIKERIKALQPKPNKLSLQAQFEATTSRLRASKLWSNPKKWKRVQALLKELEALAEE